MIVVIAILAAISVVAYQGVANNAQSAALKANLAQAAQKLELYRVDNGAYPPDQATLATLLKLDPSTTLTYAANNSTSPPTYCLTAASGSLQFSVGSANNTPRDNACVVNLADDPRATQVAIASGASGWKPLWWGGGGAGTTTSVTGAADGPIVGISTYIRKTWTTAPTGGSGNTGFYNTTQNTAGTDTTGFPVAAGTTYTFSSYIRSSKTFSGAWALRLYWHDTAGALVGTAVLGTPITSVSAGAWNRLSLTATAPAGAVVVDISSDCGSSPASSWSVGDTLDGTGLMITQGSTLYNYADGNSPGWAWTGTPNASTSIGPPL